MRHSLCSAVAAALLAATSLSAGDPAPSSQGLKFFETEVRPLLSERCHKCHGPEKQKGNLRLDSIVTIRAGGDSGPALVPGKPEESLLVEAINYESYEMPPDGKLNDEEIAVLTKWVAMGAPWPDEEAVKVVQRERITDEDRAWWAYQPVARPEPPAVDDGGWSKIEIDRFIYRRLRQEGLAPAGQADRRALIRRATFDLHGLPPTPAEVDAFLVDEREDAYQRLIDRLLESPRYGERWARHWLDLVRYAESDGFKQDAYRPNAWRYRDYVIRSLNDDKPYDRFVLEQLAGDEIAPHDPAALAATGYLRHWIYEYNQRDVRTQWSNILNDVTDVTADVFLGMGMGCARCHDHKFDPILQRDYFALQAFFAPLKPRDDVPLATSEELALHDAQLAAWEEATADIRAQIAALEQPILDNAADPAINKFPPDIRPMMRKEAQDRAPLESQLAGLAYLQVLEEYGKLDLGSKLKGEEKERWDALRQELADYERLKPPPLPTAPTVTDVGAAAPKVLIPGKREAEPIEPAFLTVLGQGDPSIDPPAGLDSTGRRTALARWIVSPDNPLSTRVIVNRVWQYHFGQGLVATSSDFGRLGEPPSHPELLDWLTAWFLEGDWKLKRLHKLIMTSATYQQTALREPPEAALMKDPGNRLLWKMPVRRLDAEQIRDAMLLASGELSFSEGGPSVDAKEPRRTIYTKVIRNERDPLLDVFDAPDNFGSTSQRNTTTTPTQSLLMINGDWTLARAEALSRRLTKLNPADDAELVESAFRLVYGRAPEMAEKEGAVEFLSRQRLLMARRTEQSEPRLAEMPGRGGLALDLDPAKPPRRLEVADAAALPDGDFTVEAVILLRSLYKDATVRTIAAHWDSDTKHPGWSFGVTSEKSKHEPRNLILQLVGKTDGGDVAYEVVASDLRPELNRPYYVAVSVKIGDTSEGGVTFYMQDLSQKGAPLLSASVAHRVAGGYRPGAAFTLGGRANSDRHYWDGLLDDVRITERALPEEGLLVGGDAVADDDTVAHWRFGDPSAPLADSSSAGRTLTAPSTTTTSADHLALIDLCHVLLNSSEFLYVD